MFGLKINGISLAIALSTVVGVWLVWQTLSSNKPSKKQFEVRKYEPELNKKKDNSDSSSESSDGVAGQKKDKQQSKSDEAVGKIDKKQPSAVKPPEQKKEGREGFASRITQQQEKEKNKNVTYVIVPRSKIAHGTRFCGTINLYNSYINHPVMQANDNNYFLEHNPQGMRVEGGSFFVDSGDLCDFSGLSTAIYGHSFFYPGTNTRLASSIHFYRDPHYFQQHPHFSVTLANKKVLKGQILAFLEVDNSKAGWHDFYTATSYKQFYELIRKNAIHFREVEGDRFVLISTCKHLESPLRYVLYGVVSSKE